MRWKYTASTSSSSADVCSLFSIDCAYTMFMPCWVPDLRSPICASVFECQHQRERIVGNIQPVRSSHGPPYIKIATKGMTPAAHATKKEQCSPVPSPLNSRQQNPFHRRCHLSRRTQCLPQTNKRSSPSSEASQALQNRRHARISKQRTGILR